MLKQSVVKAIHDREYECPRNFDHFVLKTLVDVEVFELRAFSPPANPMELAGKS